MSVNLSNIIEKIQERVILHHSLYPRCVVNGIYRESILNDCIEMINPELSPQWDCGSQKIGADITLSDGTLISCKGGQLHKDSRIKISSSRLSRFSDFELIKTYLATARTDDFIFSLLHKKPNTPRTNKNAKTPAIICPQALKYAVTVFDSSVFDYAHMDWSHFGAMDDLRGMNNQNGISVTVTKKMGYQLWYHLPVSLALEMHEFEIPLIAL